MSVFKNLLGTSETTFRVGLAGPTLKREGAAELSVRNTADSAYASVRSLLFKTFGDDFELNSGAAGAGADWKYTIRRPSTGMTLDIVIVLPSSGAPTVGDALTVTSVAAGVVTLGYSTSSGATNNVQTDSTALAFGASSPVAMFNKPANARVKLVRVIIDTPFNGTPSLSVGIAGTTSKYMPATAIDLTAAAGTVFEYDAGAAVVAGVEALIGTYAAGGASAGAARIEADYVVPN